MSPKAPTRRCREIPCSQAAGIVRLPRWRGDDFVIALVYGDPDAGRADFDRAVAWKWRPGVRAQVCSIRLEKDSGGEAWLDIGRRDILRSPSGHIREDPSERLAVTVCLGGQNRRSVIAGARRAASIWLLICQVPDPGPDTEQYTQLLKAGTVPAIPGTSPTRIPGIFTLGHLARPEPPLPQATTFEDFLQAKKELTRH